MTTHKPNRWDAHLMGLAQYVATKSKDSTQVGAVLVGKQNQVLLTAFNGPPIGVRDDAHRFLRPTKYLFANHAEANLIAFAARHGVATDGLTVYCTHFPCSACARSIIQAGITKVVVGDGTTSMPDVEFSSAKQMFLEAGVEVVGDYTLKDSEWQEIPFTVDVTLTIPLTFQSSREAYNTAAGLNDRANRVREEANRLFAAEKRAEEKKGGE